MENLILKMEKGGGGFTTKCKNRVHFLKLKARYEAKGYKQVPYIKEQVVTGYPF